MAQALRTRIRVAPGRGPGPRVVLPAVCVVTLLVATCARPAVVGGTQQGTLREYADRLGFRVGAAIHGRHWLEPRYRPTLAREFNSASCWVAMDLVQPERGRFDFSSMDRQMLFAREHGLKLLGAPLVYRRDSTPSWLNRVRRREELGRILKSHIQSVVRHGGETFYAWEVVNEPLNRNEPWESAFGRVGYIARAFRHARQANPDALLLLNESFGREGVDRDRVDRFFRLVERLKSRQVPIDAVGIEMHLEAHLLSPTYLKDFRYFLAEARRVGVEVHITEMDVYQGLPGSFRDPFARQKRIYEDVVSACLDDAGCTGFYTWGLSDSHNFPAKRPNDPRPDARPLLFDDRYERKPAYYGVLGALARAAER